jgi:hypothetical protein
LNAAQIGTGIEQMGGKGMAQYMRTEQLDDAQFLAQLLESGTNSGCE